MLSQPPFALRIALAPAVAATVLLGVWITGGLLTDDFTASALLTGVWFAATGGAALLVAARNRSLRVPVLGAYAVTAGVITLWLGWNTFRDRVVDERVVTGPALAAGAFSSGAHETTGRAAVVGLRDGGRVLTLTAFETDPGPDLRVHLVAGDSTIDLGALKGNKGNQQYRLPANAQLAGSEVVIWCRAFSVTFGSATLRA